MTSPSSLRDFGPKPLYFFDQPTGRERRKQSRTSNDILQSELTSGSAYVTTKSKCNPESEFVENIDDDNAVKSDENGHKVQHKTYATHNASDEPDTSVNGSDVGERNPGDGMDDINPLDVYKHVAPQLLSELGKILAQYEGSEEGSIPHGLVNVLNYSWKDLTAGAVYVKPSRPLTIGAVGEGAKPRKSRGSMNFTESLQQMEVNDKKKVKNKKPSVLENVGSNRSTQDSYLRKKTSISNALKVHVCTTISFSISSKTCKEQGWIVQPNEPSCDEPQWSTLCQWVVERLQLARIQIKLQTTRQAEHGLNAPPILCHYGDTKQHAKYKRRERKVVGPLNLYRGMPQIPEMKPEEPTLQKLHYRINDGSSFIYYPSGHVAVCQSHSGLPCGGFYTNVFSDNPCPVILASITAFGHGTVTHPPSGTVTAVWDQSGGLTCDPDGIVTKEWTWQTGPGSKERIVIQVSSQICVRLLSGTSVILCFKSHNESVQLPVAPLSNITPPEETGCLQTDGRFTSLAAQELSLTKTRKPQSHIIESKKRALTLKSVSMRSCEVLQMVSREAEHLEEPSLFRRGGRVGRELRRLQRRVRNIIDDWLDYYRMATGIKCSNIERMSDAPLRPRLKREVQSAALPSLNPQGPADTATGQPEGGSMELQTLPRHLSAPPADTLLDSSPKLPETFTFTKRLGREEHHHVTQTGTLRVHSNIRLESVLIPRSLELQPPPVRTHWASSNLSTPPSPCPALLRAALLGEGRRLCRCSSRVMPLLTDLEYDGLITGQPPHSEQILVVCVTPPRQPLTPHTQADEDVLEQLYERMNKNRAMPCLQCQLDSFRLVRYEMSTGKACQGLQNTLLQQRHNAAPGMFLMYLRGRLLFADYVFNGYSRSVRDLHQQITKARGACRQGQSLPSDYRFSAKVTGDSPGLQKSSVGGDAHRTTVLLEKEKPQISERKLSEEPVTSLTLRKDSVFKAKKTPAATLPILTH